MFFSIHFKLFVRCILNPQAAPIVLHIDHPGCHAKPSALVSMESFPWVAVTVRPAALGGATCGWTPLISRPHSSDRMWLSASQSRSAQEEPPALISKLLCSSHCCMLLSHLQLPVLCSHAALGFWGKNLD